MITEGATDAAIAARLGVGRMSVARHRANHVVKPAEAALVVASKGAAAREERSTLERVAASGQPTPAEAARAALSLEALVGRLRKVERRLERAAEAAEATPTALAALAGQQLRSLEFAARLGSTGGFGATKGASGEAAPFSVNIILSGAGPGAHEVITIAPVAAHPGGEAAQ